MQQRSASCPRRILIVEKFSRVAPPSNPVFPEGGERGAAVGSGERTSRGARGLRHSSEAVPSLSSFQVLELLISAKARVFPQGREGWTAVHEAASNVGDRKLCLSRESSKRLPRQTNLD